MQIGLSDSNLSDAVTLVKVGSASLILDMIDSGAIGGLLRLKKPVAAAIDLGSDWNLVRRVPTSRGEMSSLEIQRVYLEAAEIFAQSLEGPRRESADLTLRHWRRLYEFAADFRRDASNIEPAMGHLDWLTKRSLIDSLGKDASWAERKKIDLRFHELSPDGYYRQILASFPELSLVDADSIKHRRRSPPPGTRAIRRGAWIREFAADDSDASAEWSHGKADQKTRQF